ncbi:hypothetical protein, partial [Nocardioides sp.]|uniref:hypothetical protein n=1 Tax=Nocardioides sp. TaxID=35761 RepID=UPI001455F8FD
TTAAALAALSGVAASTVDECAVAGTLVAAEGRYGFAHELIRLAVEQDVASYQAAELHRMALTVLAREGANHAELAHHAEQAGDLAATLEHARAAADEAARLHSHREAIAQCRRALQVVQPLGAGDELRAELLDQLTRLHGLMDRWELAEEANREALVIRRRLGDPAQLSVTLRHRVLCLWRLCRADATAAAARELLDLTDRCSDTVEHAWALAYHCCVAGPEAMLETRLREADEAIRLGEAHGDREVVAHALQTRGTLLIMRGEDGLEDIRRALRVAQDSGNDAQAARACANLYELATAQLLHEEYDWVWDEGMRWCDDHEMRTWTLCLSAVRAQVLMRRGSPGAAIELAARALEQAISQVNRAHLHIPFLTSKVRRGDPGVHPALLAARSLAADSGDACWQLPIETAICELAWLADDAALVDAEVLRLYASTAGTEPWLRAALAAALARV